MAVQKWKFHHGAAIYGVQNNEIKRKEVEVTKDLDNRFENNHRSLSRGLRT